MKHESWHPMILSRTIPCKLKGNHDKTQNMHNKKNHAENVMKSLANGRVAIWEQKVVRCHQDKRSKGTHKAPDVKIQNLGVCYTSKSS